MKKFILLLGLFLALSSNAKADETDNISWDGVWEYQRYTPGFSGILEISDCKNSQCNFNIETANGAHTCYLNGKLEIHNNKGEYKEKQAYDGTPEDILVTFELDTQKRVITVDATYSAQIFCGVQGRFTGEYENKNNPFRYDTRFDCRAKDITDTEKTICASKTLAQANKEMTENYQSMQTKEWYDKREKCRNNEKCLWEFYISSIKSAYEKKYGKPVNFYEYMGNLSEGYLYYPTDFSLLTDFFIQNMQDQDYDEWTSGFVQMTTGDEKCDKCHYSQYGAAGLYTIMESAFYINKNEIWLAFLELAPDLQQRHIVIYTLSGYEEKDIPPAFNGWLDRLKPYFPDGIKLKYFTGKKIK